MTPSRTVLIAAGILSAVGAVVLIVLAFKDSGSTSIGTAAGSGPARQNDPKNQPRWEDYAWNDASPSPPLRPLAPIAAIAALTPFDRAHQPAGREVMVETPAFDLEGVVASQAEAWALISGRVMRVGDTINEFRITRIDLSGVSLVGPTGHQVDLSIGMRPAPSNARTLRESRRTSSLSGRLDRQPRGTRP